MEQHPPQTSRWISNLGKGQPHMSAHTHTMYKIFIRNRCARTASSAISVHSAPDLWISPLASDHPLGSTKHNRESNRGKKSKLSLGNMGLVPSQFPQQRPWQELGLALGHPSPGQERGKLQSCSANAISHTQKEKAPKKKGALPLFHLQNPCLVSVWWLGKVLLAQGGEEVRKHIGWSLYKSLQITFSVLPAFIYFTAADLLAFRFICPCSILGKAHPVPTLQHDASIVSSTSQRPGSPDHSCAHRPSPS